LASFRKTARGGVARRDGGGPQVRLAQIMALDYLVKPPRPSIFMGSGDPSPGHERSFGENAPAVRRLRSGLAPTWVERRFRNPGPQNWYWLRSGRVSGAVDPAVRSGKTSRTRGGFVRGPRRWLPQSIKKRPSLSYPTSATLARSGTSTPGGWRRVMNVSSANGPPSGCRTVRRRGPGIGFVSQNDPRRGVAPCDGARPRCGWRRLRRPRGVSPRAGASHAPSPANPATFSCGRVTVCGS
jgi:hypothetical protein